MTDYADSSGRDKRGKRGKWPESPTYRVNGVYRVPTDDGQASAPLALLAVLEEIDRRVVERPQPTVEELAQLLRTTDPSNLGIKERR